MTQKVNCEELNKYYKNSICRLVFEYENQLVNDFRHKFFTYNYDNEIDNFVRTFTEYLPYYVSNYDHAKYFKPDRDNLLAHSRRLWNGLDQKSNFESNGIFGELFLDFYRRIYNCDDILAGYATRKEFSSKMELKGIDNFSFCTINKRPTIIFSEAKFVQDTSSAVASLIDDIELHLNSQYLNKFSGFMMRQVSLGSTEHKEETRQYLDRLNEKLVGDSLDFTQAVNELEYTVKFVYFAICQSNNKTAKGLQRHFDKIRAKFDSQIQAGTDIGSYDVEIILIPTLAIPKSIKQEIVNFYASSTGSN